MLNDQSTFKWTLLPLGLTLLFYGLWRLTQVPLLAWLGVVTAMMGMALPIVALVLDLSPSQQTSKNRIQALVLKSALAGLSILICWNSYGHFSKSNPQNSKTVRIKNTTDKVISELNLNYGTATMR